MRLFVVVREFLTALRVYLSGVLGYFLNRGRKVQEAEYCHVCQVLEKPLQLGRYMIRTGPRSGAQAPEQLSEVEVYVCNRHHPDPNLEGALWAQETQEFLKKLDVAVHCVYLHHHHRQ